ncbi:MAG: hypothetical protein ABW001_15355 [Mycobacterium sp.]
MTGDTQERALLVGMPLAHLRSALEVCERHGRVVLPAGGPGDLDRAATGALVLLMDTGADEDAASAATWAARFVGRLAFDLEDPMPVMLPPSWIEEHEADLQAARDARASEEADPSAHPDEDEDDAIGPQAFFVVEDLHELPMQEWVFTNELVGKQARGGRTFFPRVPTLVRQPA